MGPCLPLGLPVTTERCILAKTVTGLQRGIFNAAGDNTCIWLSADLSAMHGCGCVVSADASSAREKRMTAGSTFLWERGGHREGWLGQAAGVMRRGARRGSGG